NNGDNNTANGFDALVLNNTEHDNVAEGYWALEHNTTGSSNIAVGSQAGANLTTGSNNIDIGANVGGVAGEVDTIRTGKSGTQRKTFIAGIRGERGWGHRWHNRPARHGCFLGEIQG